MDRVEVSEGGYSLWAVSPFNARVRMANMIKHSRMNGIDAPAFTGELANRYNNYEALKASHDELLRAAKTADELIKLITRWCNEEGSAQASEIMNEIAWYRDGDRPEKAIATAEKVRT